MRLILFASLIVNLLASGPKEYRVKVIGPNTLVLRMFIREESVYMIMFPDRETIELPKNFSRNDRNMLLVWKNMEQEAFIDAALRSMHAAHDMVLEQDPYAHLLSDRIHDLQSEDAIRNHCRLYHEALQKVPDSEWRM